ncbi:MAG: putative metal-dependent hydrolase [Ignavibacteria bacterium]|nr:putative metal-dependent hydrolase [Ignavibacteria bacterium]
MNKDDKLRYPVGKFALPDKITDDEINEWINFIEEFPAKLDLAVRELGNKKLAKPYRPGGWTGLQVVHHCADSHVNAFIRFKLALTEDTPVIKPYKEDKWAELADSLNMPAESSIALLVPLHRKWVFLLRCLNEDELGRKYYHPDEDREFTLAEALGLYAWHCKHHLAHLGLLKDA